MLSRSERSYHFIFLLTLGLAAAGLFWQSRMDQALTVPDSMDAGAKGRANGALQDLGAAPLTEARSTRPLTKIERASNVFSESESLSAIEQTIIKLGNIAKAEQRKQAYRAALADADGYAQDAIRVLTVPYSDDPGSRHARSRVIALYHLMMSGELEHWQVCLGLMDSMQKQIMQAPSKKTQRASLFDIDRLAAECSFLHTELFDQYFAGIVDPLTRKQIAQYRQAPAK